MEEAVDKLPTSSAASSWNNDSNSSLTKGPHPSRSLTSSFEDINSTTSFSTLSTTGSFSNLSGYLHVSGEGVGEVAKNEALKRRISDFTKTRFQFMNIWNSLLCDLHDQPPGMKKRKSGSYQSTSQQYFTGKELVNWLYDHLTTSEYFRSRKILITPEKARLLAIKLLENRTICNLKKPHETKFSTTDIYFIKAERPVSGSLGEASASSNLQETPSILLTPARRTNENSVTPERAGEISLEAPVMTGYVDGAGGLLSSESAPFPRQDSSKGMLMPQPLKPLGALKKCKSLDNMPKRARPQSPNQLARSSTQQGSSHPPISPPPVAPEPSPFPSFGELGPQKTAKSEVQTQTSGGLIKPPKSPRSSPRVHPRSLPVDFPPRAQISRGSPTGIVRSSSETSTRPILRSYTTGGGSSGNSRNSEFGIGSSGAPVVRRRASADNPVTYESEWFFTEVKEKVVEVESPGGFVTKEVEISPNKAVVDTEYMNEPITLQDAISYVPLADEFLTVLEFLSESHYYEFYTAQAVPTRRESVRPLPLQSQDWASSKLDTGVYAAIGDIDIDDDNRPPQRAAPRTERTYSGVNEYRNSASEIINCNPKKKKTGKNAEIRTAGGPSTASAPNGHSDELVTCLEFLKDHQLLTVNEFLADGRN